MRVRDDKAAYERVKKAMTCAYYFNGGDCKSESPVKECNPDGCIAWKLHEDFRP